MTRPHVIVIGGGIAGLSAAWTLTKHETPLRVTVLESSPRFGGKIETTPFAGEQLDTGPDAFLTAVPAARALCEEIGIAGSLVAPAESTSFIWTRGVLRNYPLGTVLGVPSNVFSLANVISVKGILRAGFDLVLPKSIGRPSDDPSIGNLIRKRLGHEIADRLIDPLVGGINAADIDHLSLRSAAPQVGTLADAHRSLIWAAQRKTPRSSPKGAKKSPFLAPAEGMQTLPDTLAAKLREAGADLRWNQPVESVAYDTAAEQHWTVVTPNESLKADAVIVAVPAAAAAQMLEGVNSRVSAELASIRLASVGMVRVAYKRSDVSHPLKGSGFVVPAVDKTLITACSWSSSKWSRLADPDRVLLRVSTGRLSDRRVDELDDDRLIAGVQDELARSLGVTGRPTHVDVKRWTNAFQVQEPGHGARIRSVRTQLEPLRGIALAGSAYDGGGIPSCIAGGDRAAQAVLSQLGDPA